MKSCYFDHNATSPVSRLHWEAVWHALGEESGNASSPHSFGRNAHVALTQARRSLAKSLGFEVSEIVFTSGGSESNTAASLGVVEDKTRHESRVCHVVVSALEHPCVLEPLLHANKCFGTEITYLKPDVNGLISLSQVIGALRPDTALVSLMAANNETGLRLPVQEFGNWLHDARWTKAFSENYLDLKLSQDNLRTLHFHTDGVQAFGKVVCEDWMSPGVDSVAVCAHKLGGLPGVGALALRRGRRFVPRVLGGPQEKSRRAGTENLPGVISLGIVAANTMTLPWQLEWQKIGGLTQELGGLLSQHKFLKKVLPLQAPCLSNTLKYVVDPKIMNVVDLVMELDMAGLCVSTGSACSSGVHKPSGALLAMGFSEDLSKNALRISLGIGNEIDEIKQLALKIMQVASRFKTI